MVEFTHEKYESTKKKKKKTTLNDIVHDNSDLIITMITKIRSGQLNCTLVIVMGKKFQRKRATSAVFLVNDLV